MEKLMALVETVQESLRADVAQSFLVPQRGTHHCEGMFMSSHLEHVLATVQEVKEGRVHEAVPSFVHASMQQAAVRYSSLIVPYVLLHDIDKVNCMTFVYADETSKAVSWVEWEAMLAEVGVTPSDEIGVRRVLSEKGVVQISYFQKVSDETRMHGHVAAERLKGLVDDLIVRAIDTHEIAFQFGAKGGINIPLFESTFGSWTDADVSFALLVNYADQAGSLREDGKPNISDFVWLAKSYRAAIQYRELKQRIEATSRLDPNKVTRLMSALQKDVGAFQAEDVDTAYARVVGECSYPTYDEAKLRLALIPFVESGSLAGDVVEALVSAAVATGQVPKELGGKLGKHNKAVREAMAKAV